MGSSRSASSIGVFRLVETIEIEIDVDDEPTTLRLELFQDATESDQFRARTYEVQRVRISGTDEGNGQGESAFVLVPWEIPGGLVTDEPFVAPSIEEALGHLLDDLQTYLTLNGSPGGGEEPGSV